MSHGDPETRINFPLLVKAWAQIGLHKTYQQLRRHFPTSEGYNGDEFREWIRDKLSKKVFVRWRKRIRNELEEKGYSATGGVKLTYAEAEEVYKNCLKLSNAGRPRKWPDELNPHLQRRLEDREDRGKNIGVAKFLQLAREEATKYDDQQRTSLRSQLDTISWTTLRKELTTTFEKQRKPHNKREPLPDGWEECAKVFVARMLKLIEDNETPPSLVLNLDETSIQLINVPSHTYTSKQKKTE
jgi:hypothetical protein